MLKCIKYMSPAGKKAVFGASAWLAAFHIACMLPMIIIIHVFSKMIQAYENGTAGDFMYAVYITVGTVMVIVMYYRVIL